MKMKEVTVKIQNDSQYFPRSESDLFERIKTNFWLAFHESGDKYDHLVDSDDEHAFDRAVWADMEKKGYRRIEFGVETPEYLVKWNKNITEAKICKK